MTSTSCSIKFCSSMQLGLVSLLSLVVAATLTEAAVPEFTVSLDEAPEVRWRGVMMYYLNSGMLHSQKLSALSLSTQSTQQKWSAAEQSELVNQWAEVSRNVIPEEYKRELEGMVKLANEVDPFLNTTVDEQLFGQLGYEQNYPEYCSGLLTATANGTAIHARNMDYFLQFEHQGHMIGWPELTVNVVFTRGGRPLYTSVTWPWQVGIHTAMRFDGWTFEQNTRRTGDDMLLNLEAGRAGGLPFGVVARKVMEEVPDFETAVQRLYEKNFMATSYFIMTGSKPYEGAVLSIDRAAQHLEGTPKIVRLSQQNWHIIQTNDDQGEPTDDERRPIEEFMLTSFTQDVVNPAWAFNQMRQPPLFNYLTVFTWIAIPATNYYKLVVREEPVPESLVLLQKVRRRPSFLRRAVVHH